MTSVKPADKSETEKIGRKPSPNEVSSTDKFADPKTFLTLTQIYSITTFWFNFNLSPLFTVRGALEKI